MPEATFTFRVDSSLKSSFAEAAKLHDRTGPQLLREFMKEYVAQRDGGPEYDEWFRGKVGVGLKMAQDGHFVAHGDVEADAAARRALLLERAACQKK